MVGIQRRSKLADDLNFFDTAALLARLLAFLPIVACLNLIGQPETVLFLYCPLKHRGIVTWNGVPLHIKPYVVLQFVVHAMHSNVAFSYF